MSARVSIARMRELTGVIVPSWFPPSYPPEQAEAVLAETMADNALFATPENTLVVSDGSPLAAAAAENVRKRDGRFSVLPLAVNAGKGGAVAAALRRLLDNNALRYFVVRDHDNDHLANEAPNLVSLAEKISADTGAGPIVVIGHRQSIHRCLGFVRGELEEMMNEVVLEAVKLCLARDGKAVNLQYASAYAFTPDFQSGFKCYSRDAARLLLAALDGAGRLSPGLDIPRHGPEVPVIVETLLHGGVMGTISRLTGEEKPLSTYDPETRIECNGTVLAWTLQRAGTPLPAARQLLLNAMARRLLIKDPQGLSTLLALSNWVLEKLSGYRKETFSPIAGLHLADYC